MKNIALAFRNRRLVRDGTLITLACVTAVAGYFGNELTWLMVGG